MLLASFPSDATQETWKESRETVIKKDGESLGLYLLGLRQQNMVVVFPCMWIDVRQRIKIVRDIIRGTRR